MSDESLLGCSVCEWESAEPMPFVMSEATWHVYETHRALWNEIFGDRPPTEPDIRVPGGREKFQIMLGGMSQN